MISPNKSSTTNGASPGRFRFYRSANEVLAMHVREFTFYFGLSPQNSHTDLAPDDFARYFRLQFEVPDPYAHDESVDGYGRVTKRVIRVVKGPTGMDDGNDHVEQTDIRKEDGEPRRLEVEFGDSEREHTVEHSIADSKKQIRGLERILKGAEGIFGDR
ncbi:hypothetical protein BJ508DRAFT_306933 [Ascobolus immersus RN42]|uniref:Uncharacterized protein n=1 Tax=Ascobolus immersus RN42 TaxID=1160509 RepID=A0A3N4I4E8_ASCIM|nr:hypothetical protein BJ508DRAFT_306933 [Ascobolus immersus RN42]